MFYVFHALVNLMGYELNVYINTYYIQLLIHYFTHQTKLNKGRLIIANNLYIQSLLSYHSLTGKVFDPD